MKITKRQLKRIIREEYNRIISEDDSLRGNEGEEYDQERVNRMIMFLDDIYGSLSRTVEFEYNPGRVFHKLQNEFPDASEEEIAAAMDSYGQSLY